MEDDLFQSLGGSLMKDLLADLQGDDGEGDGWLSLEQLEKELSQLDDNSAPLPPPPAVVAPLPTAASIVVTGQQQFQQQQQQQQQPIHGVGLLGDVTVTKQAPADAWKESLQKFTALSLDQDFLAADTVRKQQKGHQQQPAPPQLPPGFLAEAEDYDATEKVTLKPPPGLGGGGGSAGPPPPPGMKAAAAAAAPAPKAPKKEEEQEDDDDDKDRETKALLAAATLLPGGVPSMPSAKPLPKTPANSEVVSDNEGPQKVKLPASRRMLPKTPRNSVIISSVEEAEEVKEAADEEDEKIPIMGKVSVPAEQPSKLLLPTKTPRNSVAIPSKDAAAAAVVAASASAQGMAMPSPQQQQQQQQPGMPHQGGMPPVMPPQQGAMPPRGMPVMGMPPQGMPPPPPQGMPPQGMQPGVGMPPPPGAVGMPGGGMPMMMPPTVPVATMPTGGPAWQRPPAAAAPPVPPPPPMRVFCNPHPNAPPIPSQVLESRMMKSRDITYIVHSIMKPVLQAGFSEHDYDIQLLYRQSGRRPAGPRPMMRSTKQQDKNKNKNEEEEDKTVEQVMAFREQKSKEWSTKHAALGHVAKSNVARPRALIASPALSQANQEKAEGASEQKQRARLWKARIYCDQAYQAYLAVVDIWAKATPGSVPPGVHAPLIRLMKCLGIAPVSPPPQQEESPASPSSSNGGGDFQVDASVLQLFLKLSKGRILFARIVEQALLPPSAVQTVLPATLDILYKTPLPSSNADPNKQQQQQQQAYGGDLTDDRCFRALTGAVQTLPMLSGESILQCAEVMKAQSEAALSSTSRMECLHAVLQRGTSLAASSDKEDFKGQWKETEDAFIAILSGM